MSNFFFFSILTILFAQIAFAQRLATRIDDEGHTVVITGPNGYVGTSALPSNWTTTWSHKTTSYKASTTISASCSTNTTVSSFNGTNSTDASCWSGSNVTLSRVSSSTKKHHTSVTSSSSSYEHSTITATPDTTNIAVAGVASATSSSASTSIAVTSITTSTQTSAAATSNQLDSAALPSFSIVSGGAVFLVLCITGISTALTLIV